MSPSRVDRERAWPELAPLEQWRETLETLHLWLQIVGKVRLVQTPWTNHSWHVPLYVTPCGLTTSTIHHDGRAFEIDFDFIDQRLCVRTSDGARRSFALVAMSVSAFYERLMQILAALSVETRIWPQPVEIPDPIRRFSEDEKHAAYDPEPVTRLWRVLLAVHAVFSAFRARFVGKASPVHLFWGAFDLAVTRFSGRSAPRHPGGAPNCPDWVMEEAYSHELSSAGFWPGTGLGEPAFYSYAYPEPAGFADYAVGPDEARYSEELGEFVLPYEVVRRADDPEATLLEFLQTTYEAAADLGDWDAAALERVINRRRPSLLRGAELRFPHRGNGDEEPKGPAEKAPARSTDRTERRL